MPAATPSARRTAVRLATTGTAIVTTALSLGSVALAAPALATSPPPASPHAFTLRTVMHASAPPANYGGVTTIAISVREKFGAVPHATLRVYRKNSTGTHYVTALSTGSHAVAHFTVRPSVPGTFEFTYAGSGAKAPSVTWFHPAERTFGASLVAAAARKIGAPYQWGASGPTRFDCSGLVRYVAHEFGRSLPRTAASQYAAVHHIAKSDARLGDLIFMYDGSGIYHVGFYAGHGRMLAATHTGSFVRIESIYSPYYLVGRLAP